MKRIHLLLAVAAISVAALAASPSPAGASGCIPSSGSWNGGKVCDLYGSYLNVCDTAVDGNRVRAWYNTSLSFSTYVTRWAPSQGCTGWVGATNHQHITRYKLCVERRGCTGWRNT